MPDPVVRPKTKRMRPSPYLALCASVLSSCVCQLPPSLSEQPAAMTQIWPTEDARPSDDAEKIPRGLTLEVDPSQLQDAWALLANHAIIPISASTTRLMLGHKRPHDTESRPALRSRPYLARAIGVRGCGTGGFTSTREHNEVWIGFGGLGGGSINEKQAVIVYLDHCPSAIHLLPPSMCL